MLTESDSVPQGMDVFVEKSILGKRWKFRDVSDRDVLSIAQKFSLPEIVARVICARKISLENVESFLSPTLRDFLIDPFKIKDMDRAVDRAIEAINNKQGIGIFGDYDVDGASSTALAVKFFRLIGIDASFHIPDRVEEGYGPSMEGFQKLKDKGARLIITVDCGVSAIQPILDAKNIGLDVIVLDHHVATADLPAAAAIVNPNRLDDDSGLGSLAAVGVVFMFLVALNRRLRESKWYETNKIAEPNLLDLLDLVALGTICDVVPLEGLNRAFVTQGLKILAQRKNTGLKILAEMAKINERAEAYHLGYILGPRINAGGRIGKASLGAQLLSSDDIGEAMAVAEELEKLNDERRRLEAIAVEDAIDRIGRGQGVYNGFILAQGDNWHPGVVGIVAGRVKELYQIPVAAVTMIDGLYKGSSRSITGVPIGPAVIAAKQLGLLESAGGHDMAAGFTARPDKLEEVCQFLSERFSKIISDDKIVPQLNVDGVLSIGGATFELVEHLEKLAPFGTNNAEPRFVFPNVRLKRLDVVGQDHLRCMLASADGKTIKAMAFKSANSPVGQFLSQKIGDLVHVAGYIRADMWGGYRNIQLSIDDVAAI